MIPILRPRTVIDEKSRYIDPSRPWKGVHVERSSRLIFDKVGERDALLVTDWKDVARLAESMIGGQDYESNLTFFLNTRESVVAVLRKEGGPVSVKPLPREIVECATQFGAASAYDVHNHPSGAAHPSDGDCSYERQITVALNAVGVAHRGGIIVTKTPGAFVRYSERGAFT